MRKIRIICVGKTQDSHLNEGLKIYENKLKRYCKLEWLIVKEANYSSGNKTNWLNTEAKNISKALSTKNFTIVCDEKGKQFSSTEFASKVSTLANQGISNIDFIIGGAFGLPKEIVLASQLKLSFSKMTFTHQMIRLILAEQIYRVFTIINNEKYHHD